MNNKTPLVRADKLKKRYGTQTVFDNVSFDIYPNEFVCLLGHSGCGKSTILNALAGLEPIDGGTLTMADKPIASPALERGVVFQSHALLPWLSVGDNVGFAITAHAKKHGKTLSKDELAKQIGHYLALVGLAHAQHKKPAKLSGGMKQRVGIARGFAIKPKLLLMDEPFGALDALTRHKIQDELLTIVAKTAQTVFMITHDIDEAILLADRIFLMSNGPNATLAQIVHNTLPKPRRRETITQNSYYGDLRRHLLEFLYHGKGQTQTTQIIDLQWQGWGSI